jgi:phosphatidate cytidylyltransferase
MSDLLTRSITGFFIVTVTLAAVYLSPYSCLAFLCMINAFGWYEFIRLNSTGFNRSLMILIPIVFTLWLGIFGYLTITNHNQSLPYVGFPVLIALLIMVLLFQKIPVDQISRGGRTLFSGSAYITLPLSLGCLLFYGGGDYKYLILIPILLIWMNDVGGYLVGSKWGKHKIAPGISPGKSVEGAIGGMILALAAAYALTRIWPDIKPEYTWFLGISVPFFALAGDLYESTLKRASGVKDSGSILPGHGGFLDRYDSFLFVMPVAALGYFIFTP